MDERTKRRVGEQVEPGGRAKAPGRLAVLQRFVNTWNHEFPADWDRLKDGRRAGAWLATAGLIPAGTRIGAADAARLRRLREAIRDLIDGRQHGRLEAAPLEIMRQFASRAPLVVDLDDRGRTSLEPVPGAFRGAVAALLGILHEAQLDGTWVRLRVCRQCRYAFFDRSKNQSARWCAMSICGNRTKNRAYRRRRASRG